MLIFDLEANGLYQDATRIHCIAYHDSTIDETLSFNDEYIMKVNSIDWESNETILWMNDCSENYLFKKQAKKIRKNN